MKNVFKKFLLQVLAHSFFFVTLKGSANELRILTYDSMVGSGSLGEAIEAEFKKQCMTCTVKFLTTKDLWSLFQKIKKDLSKENSKVDYHGVLGISEAELNWAKDKGWLENGRAFEWSPFAILYDSKKITEKDLPKKWDEFPKKLKGKFLAQDPRLSQVGLGWLEFVFEKNQLSVDSVKTLRPRYFPSWSSSYESFLKGIGGAIWTYRTSAFYHECNDGPEINQKIKVMQFDDVSFPAQINYFSQINEKWLSNPATNLTAFEDLLMGQKIQNLILTKNWMLPVNPSVEWPDCVTRSKWFSPDLKKIPEAQKRWDEQAFKKALDIWSAL